MSDKQKLKRLTDVLRDNLGEAIHCGFRKGVDGGDSAKIWKLIRDMPDQEYADYVEWVRRSLFVSAGLEE